MRKDNHPEFVNMSMKSSADWSKRKKAEEFAEILLSEDDFLLPEKYDKRQPERLSFNQNNLETLYDIWADDSMKLSLSRRRPYQVWMSVEEWRYREFTQFNELAGGFDTGYFMKGNNSSKLLALAERLYSWGKIIHGYFCHEREWQTKNEFETLTKVADGKDVWVGGVGLQLGLPGIYWANFFGPTYVQFLGKEKFYTAPAYHKKELPDGGFLITTAPSPLDYRQADVPSLQEQIIDHLGRDAFFEKSQPGKICRVPELTFEQMSLGKPIQVIAYDPVEKAIPDAKRFIQEVSALSESLAGHYTDDLNYTEESLDYLDDLILKKSYRRPEPWATEPGRRLLQELTAYYGEVLRRNFGGEWSVLNNEGSFHPVVIFRTAAGRRVEFPFARIDKLWSERERSDSLSVRYHLVRSGQLDRLENYLEKFDGPEAT